MNKYLFKVTFYGDRNVEIWYPPILAETYSRAIRILYNDAQVESATLKSITLPDDAFIAGRGLHNPTNYDNG